MRTITIHTDGGSRGNPGPASAAYVLHTPDGRFLGGKGIWLGSTTNNVAEYTAMLEGIRAARALGAERIEAVSDSELMVRQLQGRYRVKSPNLKHIYDACIQELAALSSWSIKHVLRAQNKQADELANKAMDRKADVDLPAGRKASGPAASAGPAEGAPAAPAARFSASPDAQPAPARKRTIKPLRLAILLSGGGTTMLNLNDHIRVRGLPAEIALVVSSRAQVAGVERARNIGLEPVIIRRKDHPDLAAFSDAVVAALDDARIDLVVQAGWLCLWHIPDRYANRVMNIHPALLPSFGGQGMWGHHVHEAVLAAGCKVSGCTVHFANNEYDAGPIILQRTCPAHHNDTPDTLAQRVFEQECIAYPEAIRLFAENRLKVNGRIVEIE